MVAVDDLVFEAESQIFSHVFLLESGLSRGGQNSSVPVASLF